jgi:hypothetical protein
LDGDIDWAGTEGAYEEPGEAAGAIDDLEFEVIAGGDVEVERLPVPGVVDAEAMWARGHGDGDRVSVHEFRDWLAVEFHDDLAELDVVGRVATDGDLGLGSWRRGGAHRLMSAHSLDSLWYLLQLQHAARSGWVLAPTTGHSQEWLCYLLLEEVLEGLASVIVARGRGS